MVEKMKTMVAPPTNGQTHFQARARVGPPVAQDDTMARTLAGVRSVGQENKNGFALFPHSAAGSRLSESVGRRVVF
jgi:hypothetical protein